MAELGGAFWWHLGSWDSYWRLEIYSFDVLHDLMGKLMPDMPDINLH